MSVRRAALSATRKCSNTVAYVHFVEWPWCRSFKAPVCLRSDGAAKAEVQTKGGMKMQRRDFLTGSATAGIALAAASVTGIASRNVWTTHARVNNSPAGKLTPPAKGAIPVAFAISEGVTVIDF